MTDVHIRKNSTGETRAYRDNGAWNEYLWADGNFACDCNRALLFQRAGGVEPPDDEDQPCGSISYSIVRVVGDDGVPIEYTEI